MSAFVHNSAGTAMAVMEAAQLNNQANQLEASGDLAGAEELFLESLKLKIKSAGEDSIQTALSKNALGELYMKMEGRWEDADRVRSRRHANEVVFCAVGIDDFDAACTRDNLGQLWEIKGSMVKAKAARERNPHSMICSNFTCSLSGANVKSKRDDLKNCARCKCTWYCSANCQKVDWRTRHKKWCKARETESAEPASTSD
ncbi:hypothetical protein EAF04_008036 [Stromatinia cepivora]|nr:hypothetical protein EAF04_008036 [Stromatinia cepivora]